MNAFGYGSRKCLGQYFADKQLRSLVMHLFDKYDVSWNNRSLTDAAFETDRSTHVDVFNVELCLTERVRRGTNSDL
jgi:cytochrome P450